MPEGHTIHRLARDLTPLLVDRPIEVSSPQGRFAADAALVNGCVLERIEAYGKHLWFWWANGLVGHVHLGLFGKFRISHDGPSSLGEVRMRLRAGTTTVDLSGPTACSIGTPEERNAIVDRLGPDPLRRDGRGDDAVARLARRATPIGALLMDQSVIAGVGNVYRAEVLFVHAIHPGRPARECTADELHGVWTTIRGMLRKGVRDNRIVTIDRRLLPRDRRLRRGDATFVYHRDRCLRCATPIQTVQLAGRPCYFCPTCQPG